MKAFVTAFIVSIFLLFTTNTSLAQDKSKFTGSLLWKVSGKGLEKPSYILGTHHFAHISFFDSVAGFKNILETTDQVMGELLMSDQTAMQMKVQQAAMLPAGEAYDKLLSPEDYSELDSGLKSLFTVGLDQFGKMKPGMISMLYTITLYSKLYPEFNMMSHEAIDAYVQRIAAEKGKPVQGLESVDDQIYAIFDAEPLKDQAESLVCSIKNVEFNKKALDQLNQYYKASDLSGMYNLAFNNPEDPCRPSLKQQYAINKERNDKWIKKLPQIMKDKSSLIAVGALHLAGEEGLLYQLAQMGYKVEVVK